jgi:hypothetical protein
MKLYTTINSNKPLLQTDAGLINLNSLQIEFETNIVPVKAGEDPKISHHKNKDFLSKAAKFFKISKVSKFYGNGWYKLENDIVLFCIIKGDHVQLVGHYPLFYLKLIYRYIINF